MATRVTQYVHLHGEVNKNNKNIELHTPITCSTDRLTINAPTIYL